jgi:hypothetical protein
MTNQRREFLKRASQMAAVAYVAPTMTRLGLPAQRFISGDPSTGGLASGWPGMHMFADTSAGVKIAALFVPNGGIVNFWLNNGVDQYYGTLDQTMRDEPNATCCLVGQTFPFPANAGQPPIPPFYRLTAKSEQITEDIQADFARFDLGSAPFNCQIEGELYPVSNGIVTVR